MTYSSRALTARDAAVESEVTTRFTSITEPFARTFLKSKKSVAPKTPKKICTPVTMYLLVVGERDAQEVVMKFLIEFNLVRLND